MLECKPKNILAQWVPIPEKVQIELISRYIEVVPNRYLTEAAFLALWKTKPEREAAEISCGRFLNETMIDAVFKVKETRQGVLRNLVAYNYETLTPSQMAYLEKQVKGDLAEYLYCCTLSIAFLDNMSAPDALHELSLLGPTKISDKDLVDKIKNLRFQKVSRRSYAKVRKAWDTLVHYRPILLDNMDTLHEGSYGAIAAALTLHDVNHQEKLIELAKNSESEPYILMAFIANPLARQGLVDSFKNHANSDVVALAEKTRVRIETPVLETFGNPETEAIMRHVTPNRWRPYGREVPLAWLSQHPTLGETEDVRRAKTTSPMQRTVWLGGDDRRNISLPRLEDSSYSYFQPVTYAELALDSILSKITDMVDFYHGRSRSMPQSVELTLAAFAASLGDNPSTWETMLSCAESWQGSLAELANLAVAATA